VRKRTHRRGKPGGSGGGGGAGEEGDAALNAGENPALVAESVAAAVQLAHPLQDRLVDLVFQRTK
jgi:hypothetical protein